jgi:hypothetical protein
MKAIAGALTLVRRAGLAGLVVSTTANCPLIGGQEGFSVLLPLALVEAK